MHDDHTISEIYVNEFGIFMRLRKRLYGEPPACPLCDKSMLRMKRPPIFIMSSSQWLSVARDYDYFDCPDRDLAGHRQCEGAFRAVLTFWTKSLTALLTLSDAELFRCRRDGET